MQEKIFKKSPNVSLQALWVCANVIRMHRVWQQTVITSAYVQIYHFHSGSMNENDILLPLYHQVKKNMPLKVYSSASKFTIQKRVC